MLRYTVTSVLSSLQLGWAVFTTEGRLVGAGWVNNEFWCRGSVSVHHVHCTPSRLGLSLQTADILTRNVLEDVSRYTRPESLNKR